MTVNSFSLVPKHAFHSVITRLTSIQLLFHRAEHSSECRLVIRTLPTFVSPDDSINSHSPGAAMPMLAAPLTTQTYLTFLTDYVTVYQRSYPNNLAALRLRSTRLSITARAMGVMWS